jgi:hypothetical protein
LAKLRRIARAELSDTASVSDLARVDWRALYERWPDSGSDWNHMRRAVEVSRRTPTQTPTPQSPKSAIDTLRLNSERFSDITRLTKASLEHCSFA